LCCGCGYVAVAVTGDHRSKERKEVIQIPKSRTAGSILYLPTHLPQVKLLFLMRNALVTDGN